MEVSVPIIAIVIVIAFSKLVRTAVWSFSALFYTWVIVTFGLYRWWLHIHHDWSSKSIVSRTEKTVQSMKEDVHRKFLKRREVKFREERERRLNFKEKTTGTRVSDSQSTSRLTELEGDIESQSTISRQRTWRIKRPSSATSE